MRQSQRSVLGSVRWIAEGGSARPEVRSWPRHCLSRLWTLAVRDVFVIKARVMGWSCSRCHSSGWGCRRSRRGCCARISRVHSPPEPLLRRSAVALCVVLGIVLVIVCGFAAIVDRDSAGYVGAVLSAVLSFGLAAYMWKVRVIITTDVERVSITLSPGAASGISVGRSCVCHCSTYRDGLRNRLSNDRPGMRVILASPGDGVRFRLHDGREISVATPRRDELIELARRRAPDLQ